MKITKFIFLAVVAMFLSACEKANLKYDSFDGSASSLSKASFQKVHGSKSYLVISSTNKLPKNLGKYVASANGFVVNTISEIGVAVASSDDPDFAGKASKIKGVGAVVPDLKLQYVNPEDKKISIDADFGNPPASGDDDFYFDLQWGHDAIDAPEAWEAGFRGEGVKVGVLDTGFDLDHPDLAPNISPLSRNFVIEEELDYSLNDTYSHGSHTAGTIAAADNGFGTIGVAPLAELVLVKVLSDSGSGWFSDIYNGIIYATSVGCDVINMSIGSSLEKGGNKDAGYTGADAAWYKNIYGRAITYAYQNGTTVITSAGNESTDYDHSADLIHLPSGAAHALSISATAPIGWAADPSTNLDVFAQYSNYGQSAIDFAAPGGNYMYPGNELCQVSFIVNPCWVFDLVFSTGNGGWYWSAGTSMAAPHAAGVAALIIEKNGGPMKPAQVEAALRASADDLGKPGNDDFYGQGRVNALRAVMN